jgi:hypothetical protein
VFDYPFSDLTIGSGGKFYQKAGNYLQANTVTASAADYGEIEMRLPVGANHYLVRTGSPTPPAAPVLTASSPANTATSTNQVVLDWNNAAGATGYDIHEDLNTPDHVVASVPVSNATFGNPTPGQQPDPRPVRVLRGRAQLGRRLGEVEQDDLHRSRRPLHQLAVTL